jgi:hypothetical protein
MTSKLRLSLNSKTSPEVRNRNDGRASTYPKVANSFGLPAGVTCPGKTDFCSECYAIGTEGRPYVYKNVTRNLEVLRDKSEDEMYELISEMMREYNETISLRKIPKEHDIFRIHWDGDFFSTEYAAAWRRVIEENPQTKFWTYTRSFAEPVNVVPILIGIKNLAFYLSVDEYNIDQARLIKNKYPKVLMAFCAGDQFRAEQLAAQIGKKHTTVCPENSGDLPLMSDGKGACVNCLLCPKSRPNILFVVGEEYDLNAQQKLFEIPVEVGRKTQRRDPKFDPTLLGGLAIDIYQ